MENQDQTASNIGFFLDGKMAAFLSSDKQLKDVRTCGPLADPSSCCDRARWTLPCLGAAIPM